MSSRRWLRHATQRLKEIDTEKRLKAVEEKVADVERRADVAIHEIERHQTQNHWTERIAQIARRQV